MHTSHRHRYPFMVMGVMLLMLAGCAKEYHLSLTVNPDGSADINTRYTVDRDQVEQMVRWVDRKDYGMYRYGDEEGWVDVVEEGVVIEDDPERQEADDVSKPLTDEQVIEGFTILSQEQSPLKKLEGVSQDLLSILVEEDLVRVEGKTHFDSLELLVKHGSYYWRPAGIEAFRLEPDDEGRLVATATLGEQGRTNSGYMRRILKRQKFTGSFRFQMPGTIVASPLPNTEGDKTWLEVDATDNQSLDRVIALMTEKLQIVAEPGELDMSVLPLDSTELAEPYNYGAPKEPDPYSSLALVEPSRGYYTEAETLKTTTLVMLPGAKEKLGERIQILRLQFNNSAEIQAKVYAPEGHKLLSVTNIDVDKVTDDMGNPIQAKKENQVGDYGYSHMSRYLDSDDESNSAGFQVILELPVAGAQAIEEVTGTLTAFCRQVLAPRSAPTTSSSWTTSRRTRCKASAK